MAVPDPKAPRRKRALRRWVRRYNLRHPNKPIETPKGFNPRTKKVGAPARELLKRMQRAAGQDVSGQFEQAILVLEQALESDPFSAETLNNLATAYMQKGMMDKAEN